MRVVESAKSDALIKWSLEQSLSESHWIVLAEHTTPADRRDGGTRTYFYAIPIAGRRDFLPSISLYFSLLPIKGSLHRGKNPRERERNAFFAHAHTRPLIPISTRWDLAHSIGTNQPTSFSGGIKENPISKSGRRRKVSCMEYTWPRGSGREKREIWEEMAFIGSEEAARSGWPFDSGNRSEMRGKIDWRKEMTLLFCSD